MPSIHIDWVFLVLAVLVGVLIATWSPYRRLLREANLARARGDLAAALDAALRERRSWLPLALLNRVSNPGLSEGHLALCYHELGDEPTALRWVALGLPKARKPQFRTMLHFVGAIAHAHLNHPVEMDRHLAGLDDSLAQAPSSWVDADTVRLTAYFIVGRVEEALQAARDRLADSHRQLSLRVAPCLVHTLSIAGRFGAAARMVDIMLQLASGEHGSDPVSLEALAGMGTGLDDLRRAALLASRWEVAVAAIESAYLARQWDRFEQYLNLLAIDQSDPPVHRGGKLRFLALWAAQRRCPDEAVKRLAELEALAEAYAAYVRLRAVWIGTADDVWRWLGEHERALACLAQLNGLSLSPLARSESAWSEAESLAALGRNDRVEQLRRQAADLAPGAYWNHPDPDPRDDDDLIRLIDARATIAETAADASAGMIPNLTPVPRAASKVACAAWIIAVPALTPIIGSPAALALAILAVILLCRRSPLPHDRRVGWAALLAAALSLGSCGAALAEFLTRDRGPDAASLSSAEFPLLPEADESAATNGLLPETEDATSHGLGASAAAPTDRADAAASEAAPPVPAPPSPWSQRILLLGVLIFSIMLHEIGHAVSAYWAGDPTARDLRRFSLNPVRHLAWFGSVILPTVLSLLPGGTVIGWAKPVPFQPARFRHPRRGRLGVSLAGVSLNLLIALAATNALLILLIVLPWFYPQGVIFQVVHPLRPPVVVFIPHAALWEALVSFLKAAVWINCLLAGLNLIPLPPLDGFGAIRALAPAGLGTRLDKVAGLGTIILLLLIAFNLLLYLLMPGMFLAVLLLQAAETIGGG